MTSRSSAGGARWQTVRVDRVVRRRRLTLPPLRTHQEQCLTSEPDASVRLTHVNYRRKGRCNIQPEGLFR